MLICFPVLEYAALCVCVVQETLNEIFKNYILAGIFLVSQGHFATDPYWP